MGLNSRILSFEYEDVEEGDDMLKVSFADPFMELVDSPQFVENTEWSVQWGFAGALHPPRKVLVKKPGYRYGEVTIEALDKGCTLKNSEAWKIEQRKSYKDVVEQIAKKNGMKADVDSGLNSNFLESLPYGGRSDYDILKYIRSRSPDHSFRVTNDTLEFKKRALDDPPVASFEYKPGQNCRITSVDISIKDQDNAKSSKQTTGVAIDPETFKKKIFKSDEGTTSVNNLGDRRVTDTIKTDFSGSIQSPSTGNKSGGRASTASQGDSSGKILVLPPKKTKELKNITESKRRSSLLGEAEASFEIVASPDDEFMRSGTVIQVAGLGVKYSGTWYVLDCTHDLSNGYLYKFKCSRNAVGSKKRSSKLNGRKNKKSLSLDVKKLRREVLGAKSGVAA